jgi:hypothetical protein
VKDQRVLTWATSCPAAAHQHSGQEVEMRGPDHQRSDRDGAPSQQHAQGGWLFSELAMGRLLFVTYRNGHRLSHRT